jgi:hypothetical protein
MSDDDFFNKFGLTVEASEVEIGKIYPLYGMITQILNPSMENFTIEINSGLVLKCSINDEDSVEKIKERAFEPAIFVTQITSVNPVAGDCTTIIFGKRQHSQLT